MTTLQFLNAFRTYSADVLVLALGVTLLTSLLKKTAMKSCPKKVFVFLPFLIGIAVYAVYRALVTMSPAPFTSELAATLEKGFSCGLAATLYYIVYEQFFRTGKPFRSETPLSYFLGGFVPEESMEEAVSALKERCSGASEEELPFLVRETLQKYTEPALPDAELDALCAIVVKYFSVTAA